MGGRKITLWNSFL